MLPSRGNLMVLRALEINNEENKDQDYENSTIEVFRNLQNTEDVDIYQEDDSYEYLPSLSEESSSSVEHDIKFRKKSSSGALFKKLKTQYSSDNPIAEEFLQGSSCTDNNQRENDEIAKCFNERAPDVENVAEFEQLTPGFKGDEGSSDEEGWYSLSQ
ncbi:hypothetical protein FQA39_LY06804 [Lamprigera yunnana]|nr:hypothetical protein FQA39_LY06804 [Lamprigera yunnana]